MHAGISSRRRGRDILAGASHLEGIEKAAG